MNALNILLAEDSEGDAFLTIEAFKDTNLDNSISVVRDGEQAIDFLNKRGVYAGADRPDLILLDINMPRVDGNEVLIYIKTQPEFKAIPVIILTTSNAESDKLECLKNYADQYLSKPLVPEILFDAIKQIQTKCC